MKRVVVVVEGGVVQGCSIPEGVEVLILDHDEASDTGKAKDGKTLYSHGMTYGRDDPEGFESEFDGEYETEEP